MGYLDVGGGLGIDYDGSRTATAASKNYSLQNYANDVVATVRECCEGAGIAVPTLVSESGRALASHFSVLVTNVLGEGSVLGAGGLPRAVPAPVGEEALILRNLRDTHAAISAISSDDAAAIGEGLERLQEAWNDALKFKDDAMAAFRLGYLSLPERGLAEQLTWACCQGIAERLALLPADAPVPDELRALPAALASTYYANLSVFRSAPDTWAIDQLFPVLPLQRLDEPPSRLGSFADLTCDSDGKLARFINPDGRSGRGQVKTLLELHPLRAGEPYWVGLFLAGAYQEVMGNLHNLFGSTDSVHIRVAPGGGYRVDHVVRGDTNGEVLQAMEHDPQLLLERLRMASETAIALGQLAIGDARLLMDHLETSLRQTTYLQAQ
jgi:arginine decarboxylase